jgi:hypothetical protein
VSTVRQQRALAFGRLGSAAADIRRLIRSGALTTAEQRDLVEASIAIGRACASLREGFAHRADCPATERQQALGAEAERILRRGSQLHPRDRWRPHPDHDDAIQVALSLSAAERGEGGHPWAWSGPCRSPADIRAYTSETA